MATIAIPKLDREVFETVVKSIYTDPRRASLREIIANAIDANRERHANTAFPSVEVSFDVDSITVSDKGTGISPDSMTNIYGAMFQSTKRSGFSDTVTDANGEHGIGSKTPFGLLYDAEKSEDSIANYYIVNTVHDSVRYVYKMYLNADGIPSYDLMYQEQTDADSGTQVTFPNVFALNPEWGWITTLEEGEVRVLWEVLLPFIDGNHTEVPIVFKGNNYVVMQVVEQIQQAVEDASVAGPVRHYPNAPKGCMVKYKNILYPINPYTLIGYLKSAYDDLSGEPSYTPEWRDDLVRAIESIYNHTFLVFEVDLNDIEAPLMVNRSRDRFEFDDNTTKAILALCKDVMREFLNTVSVGAHVLPSIIKNSKISNTIYKNSLIESLKKSNTVFSIDVNGKYRKSNTTSLISEFKGVFECDIDTLESVVIGEVDYSKLVDLLFTYGDISSTLRQAMVRDIVMDHCEVYDKLCELFSNAAISHCFIASSRFRSLRASDPITYSLLSREKTAFLIRDTRSFTPVAEGLLRDRENDYKDIFVVSAKDISKEDFERDGYTSIYVASELMKKDPAVQERLAKAKENRAQRIKGIRSVQEVFDAYDTNVMKKNQKSLPPKDVYSLLARYSGNVFYSFNNTFTEVLWSKDGEMAIATKESDRYSDTYAFSMHDKTVYTGDVKSSLPPSSIVFYLDRDAKQDFSDITDVGTNLDEHIRDWFSNLTINVSGCVTKAGDVELALSELEQSHGDNTAMFSLRHLIDGAIKVRYFEEEGVEPVMDYSTRYASRQVAFDNRFVVKTCDPNAKKFVNDIYQGLLDNPTLEYIVGVIPPYSLDLDKHRVFVDYVLDQLGVEKF